MLSKSLMPIFLFFFQVWISLEGKTHGIFICHGEVNASWYLIFPSFLLYKSTSLKWFWSCRPDQSKLENKKSFNFVLINCLSETPLLHCKNRGKVCVYHNLFKLTFEITLNICYIIDCVEFFAFCTTRVLSFSCVCFF